MKRLEDQLRQHWWFYQGLLFLGLTLVWLIPWAYSGRLFLGDDLGFHLNRLNGVAQYIRQTGHWWQIPPVATGSFSQWGYPVYLFYPTVTLLPAVWLSLLLPPLVAYHVFLGLVTWGTLEVTAWVGYRILGSRLQGLLVAVIYGFSQYRLLDFFVRSAVSEGLVFLFLPLVVFGVYSIAYGNYHWWPGLALGLALTILTHVLSSVLSGILVIVLLGLWGWRRQQFGARVGRLFLALGLTLILSSGFSAPLLEQLRHTGPLGIMTYSLAQSALKPGPLLLDSLTNAMSSNQINLGLSLLLVSGVVLLVWRRLSGVLRYLFLVGWGCVWCATDLFPWRWLPASLNLLQFPWRFLALASFLLALVGARALVLMGAPTTARERLGLAVGVTSIVMFLALTANLQAYRQFGTTPKFLTAKTYPAMARQIPGQDFDYVPRNSVVAMGAIRTQSVTVMNTRPNGDPLATLQQLRRQVQPLGVTYQLRSQRRQSIKLPMINVYGDHYWVNGRAVSPRIDANHVPHVPVRVGMNRVTYRYQATVVQRLSGGIAWVGWLGLLTVGFFRYWRSAVNRKSVGH